MMCSWYCKAWWRKCDNMRVYMWKQDWSDVEGGDKDGQV